MELVCEFCTNSKTKWYNDGSNCICKLGWTAFTECQIEGGKNYFTNIKFDKPIYGSNTVLCGGLIIGHKLKIIEPDGESFELNMDHHTKSTCGNPMND